MRVGGTRAAVVAMAVAAALAAGCGGDDGEDRPQAPRTAEAEEATLDRLGAEVEQNRCKDPAKVWHSAISVPRKGCREVFKYFPYGESFAIGDVRPYGPAAVIGFGRSGITTIGLVLDRDRKYRVVAVTTKLRARPTEESDRVAERAVEAMADEDCAALASLSADTGEAGESCELEPVVDFSRALDAAGDPPKPRRLGGEGGIGFYEVVVEDRFHVLVLVEDEKGKLAFANVFPAG